MDDTSPEIAEKMREMIREESPGERAMLGSAMYAASRCLVTCGIRDRNPNIAESELRKELFLIYYGEDFEPEEREKILKHLDSHACKAGLL